MQNQMTNSQIDQVHTHGNNRLFHMSQDEIRLNKRIDLPSSCSRRISFNAINPFNK